VSRSSTTVRRILPASILWAAVAWCSQLTAVTLHCFLDRETCGNFEVLCEYGTGVEDLRGREDTENDRRTSLKSRFESMQLYIVMTTRRVYFFDKSNFSYFVRRIPMQPSGLNNFKSELRRKEHEENVDFFGVKA
jgi:hypothetical protein